MESLERIIAVAQMNSTVGDLYGNAERILAYIREAKLAGASIVVFPEQSVTGYPALDLLSEEDFVHDTMAINEHIARHIDGITAIVGSIEYAPQGPEGKRLGNVALVMRDGKIIARAAKSLRPEYDVFHEARYFTPAEQVQPIEIDGTKYGIEICEDMWDGAYAHKVTEELVEKGAEVIINISASPFHVGKKQERFELISRHSREHNVPFLYVNMVGGQDDLIFDGASMVANADGTLAAQAHQFSEELLLVDFGKKREEPLTLLKKEEEIFRALVLGVRDFYHKNGMKKAVLGVSGGIDSALTGVVAAEALGPENVLGISMPSQYSSTGAYSDAKALCENLGAGFDLVPIGKMYDAVMAEVASKFAGKEFDVTEENVQARLRMVTLWAYANKLHYAPLCTGDKSEVALGYYTLYGDGAGALSVISDLTKTEVYDVSRWYNESRGREIVPAGTLTKAPSPELKPGQVAPFEYGRLSPMLEMLAEGRPVQEIFDAGFTLDEVRMAYRKLRGNEFKRYQSPPGLKVKNKTFGRGRMYPITNKYIPSGLLD